MIKDEFTGNKTLSRQRRYQLRHKRDGLCVLCKKKAVMSGACLEHAVKTREYQRRKQGCERRLNSKSYRLEKENNHARPTDSSL